MNIAKGADPVLAIKLSDSTPVQYCTNPVSVAGSLTIDGTFVINGMFVSISQGYISGEDELVYSDAISTIKGTWDQTKGVLHLVPPNGSVTPTNNDYCNAIKTVIYKNNKPAPTLGVRKISITLDDADYLDETKHFYQFISKPKIKWTEARDEAAATLYHGLLRGYLATILTKGESDFINLKTRGEGWIGASDEKVEEEWRWVTGPEGLMGGGDGLLFWKGSGIKAKLNNPPGVYGPVKDLQGNPYYFNWNNWDSTGSDPCTFEPNNWVSINNVVTCGASNVPGEDYAHITTNLKWNDYANDNQSTSGYLIEFGGMENVTLELSATVVLQVNTMLFKNDPITAICEGTSVTLNQPDLYTAIPATYSWNPIQTLSDATIANPVAMPTTVPTTTYTVTGTRGTCPPVTATYSVPVNPKPVSLLNPEENICNGKTIPLVAGNDPSYTYKWSNNTNSSTANSVTVNTAGDYSVTITTDKNCTAPPFTTKVIVHEYPTIDLPAFPPICGNPKSTIVNIPTNATDFTLTSSDGRATVTDKLTVSVTDDGVYPMVYKASIYPTCEDKKNFDLSFYKNPTVDFTINDQKCYGYNLEAEYVGDADKVNANFTWVYGGQTIIDGIGRYKETIPLGINQTNRNLVLTVMQNGCSGQHTLSDIRVTPTLNMSVSNSMLCQSESFNFLATNTEIGVIYDWSFGDGMVGTGPTPTHNYALSGKYDVQVTVTTNQNCTNTALIKEMVFAAPVPVVTFSLLPTDCLEPGPNEVSFTGTGLNGTGNDQYIWDLNDFTASEQLNNPQATPGPFKFDLITKPSAKLGLKVISEFGCESAPENIILNRKPDFTITSDVMAGCIPFEPKLSGVINDPLDKVDFTWDITDGSTGSGSPYSPTFNDPDKTYSVTLKGVSSVTQCPNEVIQTDYLRTYPKPKAAFSMDNKVVYNDKPDVKFTDNSVGAAEYNWDFGDGTSSTLPNLTTHHFVKTGHLTVLLEVTNSDQCTDTISQKLLVAFDRLFPPNGFSPNAPNKVDREFLLNSDGVSTEGYHLTVLSRWNDLIFEAKDEIKGWDGRMNNGALAPAGVYVWILNYTDFLGRRHQQTGTVTLVY